MKIIEIKTMRGANYWSDDNRKLIVLKLDLQELEELPTNKIAGFAQRLKHLFPSLISRAGLNKQPGNFLTETEKGIGMEKVIQHIATEIQSLAGMDCGAGQTRGTITKGIYHILLPYQEEEAGHYAAEIAVEIAEALVKAQPYNLEEPLRHLQKIHRDFRFGPSTGAIINEAIHRGIPYLRLDADSLVQLGYAKNQVRIRATITGRTSAIGVELADNKEATKRILQNANIPVAEGLCIRYEDEMEAALIKLGFPLVIKPLDGNHGNGVTIAIHSPEEALRAFHNAKQYSRKIIIERFVSGSDFRLLIVNNRFVAAALREPAHVAGDGTSSIQQLIDKENTDPRRGSGHENMLTEIDTDEETLNLLAKNNLHPQSILKNGEICYLKGTANLSTGGTSTDVTEHVHPANILLFERISYLIGLDICGIDVIASGLDLPIGPGGGVVLEVNAAPGLRMHLAPSKGLSRNVAAPILDMLFPPGKPSRIPIIAVTGTNGKTTTSRMIAHIIQNRGFRVGLTTSDGIYIQHSLVEKGDTTGPNSTEFILKDPSVEFAVLETARGGIVRSGLGFDQCDVAVVTNIQEDHMGLSDIHTLEDMANVKAVVAKSVKKDGYVILNADNTHCASISQKTNCQIAYFSRHEFNPLIEEHCKKGGLASIYENGFITIRKGDLKFRVGKAESMPVTFGGKVHFMIENVLAASLAAYAYGFSIADIGESLLTFFPSAVETPGRMNEFSFNDFKILIDFAHNADGFRGISQFLSGVQSPFKIGIITGTGDRRDEDIRDLGRIATEMFDHIIIRQERFLRGREAAEIVNLLTEGILQANSQQSFEFIPKETDAFAYALSKVIPGTYIVSLGDAVDNAIELTQDLLKKEKSKMLSV